MAESATKASKGYPEMITPRKEPPGGELSKTDNKSNADISALREEGLILPSLPDSGGSVRLLPVAADQLPGEFVGL